MTDRHQASRKSRSPRRSFWLAAGVLGLAGACAPVEPEAEVATQEQALNAATSKLWPNLLIPVCWENPTSGNAKGRRWVRDQVTETWERHSAIILEGWGACTESSRGIRIKSAPGANSVTKKLGVELDGVKDGIVLNINDDALALLEPPCEFLTGEACTRYHANHHFGHALGFADEEDCPGRVWRCEWTAGDGDFRTVSEDNQSVMNHCDSHSPLRGKGSLLFSDQDQLGVGQMYGRHAMYSVEASASGRLEIGTLKTQTTNAYFGWTDRHLLDVNGDGFKDYVAFSGDHAYVVPGTQQGGFDHEARQFMNVGYIDWPWRRLVDVNNDGMIDLVVAAGEDAYVVPGTASGEFDYDLRQFHRAPYIAGWKELGDVNGDGFLDLVAITGDQANIVPGTASGRFELEQRQVLTWPYFNDPWKKLADVNNDGFVDYISIDGDIAYVVPGSASGTFEHDQRQYMNAGYFHYPYKVVMDVNADTFLDFVAISDVHAYVVPGTASGRFDYARRQYMEQYYFSTDWKRLTDVNNDGFVDYVGIIDDHAFFVPGTATGRFNHSQYRYMNYDYFAYGWKQISDVNGDGYKDFIGIDGETAVVAPGRSNGEFDHAARQTTVSGAFRPSGKFLTDVNGDGDKEFISFK